MNKKTKKYYIKGLDFWDDNSVTYKNPILMEHIIQKENEFYLDDEINEIAKEMKDENPDIIIEEDDQNKFDESYIPPIQYIKDYKNKGNNNEEINTKCIKCDNPVINGNTLCVKCKFKRF